jgi:tripartite-type tricarboxylate transporter receptor subunit TctC
MKHPWQFYLTVRKILSGLGLGLCCTLVLAQDYPNKPIRVVIPYGAGTGLDVLVRSMTDKLGAELKTTLVVENLPGSNGIIGTQAVQRAPADGYTLLASTQSHYTSGLMYKNMPYDPQRFVPVARFGSAQLVMVTAPSHRLLTAQMLITEARDKPNLVSFASLGSGSSAHMAGALLANLAGVQLMHVPYKEASQALTDTLRGEPTFNLVALPTAATQMAAGKLRALAVTGNRRSGSLPDIPTLQESGVPGYEFVAWYGLFAAEGTPAAVVQKVSTAVVKVASTPEFKASLDKLGMDAMLDDAREFNAKLPHELNRWQKIIQLTGAKVD